MKRGIASPEQIQAAVVNMSGLNRKAAEILFQFPVSSCTDITGFGLLGHLSEMTTGSKMDADIYFKKINLLPGIRELIARDSIPGGTLNNRDYYGHLISWNGSFSDAEKLLLFDAQTSGGLLVALPQQHAEQALQACLDAGLKDTAIIGRITGPGVGKIIVTRKQGDGVTK